MSNIHTKTRQREHPIQLFILFFEFIKTWWFLLAMLFFNVVIKQTVSGFLVYGGSIVLIVLLLLKLVSYFFRYYEVAEDGVHQYEGIFVKEHKFMPYERIQSIHDQQWFFYQPFDVVQAKIEVAGSESTIVLNAVKTSDIDLIKNYRKKAVDSKKTSELNEVNKGSNESVIENVEKTVWEETLPFKNIIINALSSLKSYIGLFVLIGIINQLQSYIGEKYIDAQIERLFNYGVITIIVLILLAFLISVLIALVSDYIKYYNFTLHGYEGYFVIERGLFERHKTTVSYDKVQAVSIKKGIIAHFLGYASISVIQAGEVEGTDKYVMPLIKENEIEGFMSKVFPMMTFPEVQQGLALRTLHSFFLTRILWLYAPLLIGIYFISKPWAWFLLILPLLFFIKYIIQRRYSGYKIAGRFLVFQVIGWFTTEKLYVNRNRIQAMYFKDSIWMEKNDFKHVRLAIKETTSYEVSLQYLKNIEAQKIYNWFSQK